MDKSQNILRSPGSRPTYWLTRFLILRLLGAIYAVAFLVAIHQIIPLIGAQGLLPVDMYLENISHALGSSRTGFERLPSLFWFAHSDTTLLTTAWIGFALSCIVLAGYANALLLAVLWLLYMSFVHAGQDWYGYGWEIQLLETGFLAIFLCPLSDMNPFPKRAPPMPVIMLVAPGPTDDVQAHARNRFDCRANAAAACTCACSFRAGMNRKRSRYWCSACPMPATLPCPKIPQHPAKNRARTPTRSTYWFARYRISACATVSRSTVIATCRRSMPREDRSAASSTTLESTRGRDRR